MSKKSVSPSDEWLIAFMFLENIIITVIVSLGHMLVVFASSSSCVWNKMPWRNLWTIVLPLHFSPTPSMIWQNLWGCGSISLKTVLIFTREFLCFRFDTVEKDSIINLSNYNRKSYTSVLPSDSNVNFLGGKEDAPFDPFLYCILFLVLHKWRSISSNFLVFHAFGGISSRLAAFLFFISGLR